MASSSYEGEQMFTHEPIPGILRHVHRLTRSFVHDGQRISYIHAYARPLGPGPEPDLEFIRAQESGFEGIACVDDVARAAILALHVHEETGSAVALRLARDWLRFVIYMQEPDGRFTNFIGDEAGTKNRHGRTSYAGGRWWTARALWALAMAWRVTGDEDYLRHFLHGRLAPTRDLKVKALQALALMELYQRRPDDHLRQRICGRSGGAVWRGRSGALPRPGLAVRGLARRQQPRRPGALRSGHGLLLRRHQRRDSLAPLRGGVDPRGRVHHPGPPPLAGGRPTTR